MPVYDFDEQHTQGEGGEAFLDSFFEARGHQVLPATRGQQRSGIDRVFLWDGKMALVEYKTDFLAHKTGKVFIETVSIDREDKPGWAFSSQADFLVYYAPGLDTIYVIPLETLREYLPEWEEKYPSRAAQNRDYATHGLLVPLETFGACASQEFHTNEKG